MALGDLIALHQRMAGGPNVQCTDRMYECMNWIYEQDVRTGYYPTLKAHP